LGFRRARWIWLAVGAALVASVAGVSYAAAGNGSPRAAAVTVGKSRSATGSTTSRSSSPLPTVCPRPVSPGSSCVMTDSPGSPVILRSCPGFPPAGDTTGECGVIDSLADGTQVTMRCWEDTSPPPDDTHASPRWFYVNEVNGPHPGWSGYVYSVLVVQQVTTPGCTQPILDQYQDPKYQPPPHCISR
jgi:hypothetical protein